MMIQCRYICPFSVYWCAVRAGQNSVDGYIESAHIGSAQVSLLVFLHCLYYAES